MKSRTSLWEAGKKIFLRKDNLFICILSGVLLLVIVWPVQNKQEEESSKSRLSDSNSSILNSINEAEGAEGEESGSWGEEETAASLERRLESILSQMEGVGEVKVMVTLAVSGEKIVEKDNPTSRSSVQEEDSAGGSRDSQEVDAQESTVYIKNENGEQTPYVVKEVSPRVEGVSVVAQGGGNALVQKNITEVIQALFGIEVHKIKVVKMK
ncbi:MAG: stage III sporulation protein AG [Lachnospiraceae bacterium]|nr:stage III sporulation protein AG [Lachnospiraceae bacterium]